MNLDQIRILQAQLAAEITELVQDFETRTTCIIHSIPVTPATKIAPVTVQVKVQV